MSSGRQLDAFLLSNIHESYRSGSERDEDEMFFRSSRWCLRVVELGFGRVVGRLSVSVCVIMIRDIKVFLSDNTNLIYRPKSMEPLLFCTPVINMRNLTSNVYFTSKVKRAEFLLRKITKSGLAPINPTLNKVISYARVCNCGSYYPK